MTTRDPLNRKHPTVAVLVDEHLLDTYLAIAALKPQRVLLVHTVERLDEVRRLIDVLGTRLGVPANGVSISDDTSAVAARDAFASLPADVHLHHTGGDGSMAASFRAAHAAAGRASADASCLDEERRMLRYDDSIDLPLRELIPPDAVTLSVLYELNGFVRVSPPRRAEELTAVNDLLDRLWPLPWERIAKLRASGIAVRNALRESFEVVRPATGYLSERKRFHSFISGAFFEHIIHRLITDAAPDYETETGVILQRAGVRLELDVVAVGRYRPHIISCMAGSSGDAGKQKAFEVLTRARQVGGLTARPILASVLDDNSRPTPEQIADLATIDRSDPADCVRVLGVESVVELGTASHSRARRVLGFDAT